MTLKELLGEAYKEGMSFEEIETALSSVELPKVDESGLSNKLDDSEREVQRLRKAISEANSKTADYKRKLLAKQTEEETKAQQDQEERERILNENKELHKKITISENASALLGIGYTPELATATAEAMFTGDINTVIQNMQSVLESKENSVRAEIMQSTPKPPVGNGDGSQLTKEKIMSIKDAQERQKAIQDNLELFGISKNT